MTLEKEFNEMIKYCFKNSKKRKKFARVFENWTQQERDKFLHELNIHERGAHKLHVYYNKKCNELYFHIICENYIVYEVKYIVTLYYTKTELYTAEVPFECPLI